MNKPVKRIGIAGAGNIGSSIAVELLLHGYEVLLADLTEAILEKARARIGQELKFGYMLRKKQGGVIDANDPLSCLTVTTSLAEMAHCDLIIENVPEEWPVKEKVFQSLDRICSPDICFCVNTSCISITRIAGITNRPGKVVGVHFMNPVYMMPTVEIMRGIHTTEDTLAQVTDLLQGLGKEAILVNDFPGFVSNRISHLFMNEAAFVYQDRVASARDIDRIFKQCFFHKMGPLETADLIGLDTVMKSIDVLYDSFRDSKFRCCPVIRQMVDAGHLGRKTGKGFYEYPA